MSDRFDTVDSLTYRRLHSRYGAVAAGRPSSVLIVNKGYVSQSPACVHQSLRERRRTGYQLVHYKPGGERGPSSFIHGGPRREAWAERRRGALLPR